MRKLHPVGSHETPLEQFAVRRADGHVEQASVHQLPGDRLLVRVEVDAAADAETGALGPESSLWHLMLDDDGRPERLEARLMSPKGPLDITLTFFEDEVLVWRRGADPSTEAVAIPPGYRLWWPPFAGRERCLLPALPRGGRDAVMTCLVRTTSAERGGLKVRPVKFTVQRQPTVLTLSTPGLPEQSIHLDAEGRAERWLADGEALGVREEA